MKKVLVVMFMMMFAASAVSFAGECASKDTAKKDNVVEEVVTLPVKTVNAVGEVLTGQAGESSKKEDKK
ncbi:MAG TPA: hypothetical protein PKY78_06410 [Candidatus Omnitrophota bacterium]|nr:hypothetical protein [Candidatus Omnitrophota bacterium]